LVVTHRWFGIFVAIMTRKAHGTAAIRQEHLPCWGSSAMCFARQMAGSARTG